MNSTIPQSENILIRNDYLTILQAALDCQAYRFCRQSAMIWLAVFPMDLAINLYLAKALIGEGNHPQAISILERLVKLDPEFIEAHEVFRDATLQCDSERSIQEAGQVYALGGKCQLDNSLPDWSILVRSAWSARQEKQWDESEKLLHQALVDSPDNPLVAIQHLDLTREMGDLKIVFQLAAIYHKRWQDCLQFVLWLAESQMEAGNESEAVALLHQCTTNDPAGQVAARIWGRNHRYRPLWPENLGVHFDLAVPSDVAARLGWNQLSQGEIINSSEEERVDEGVKPSETVPVTTPEPIKSENLAPEQTNQGPFKEKTDRKTQRNQRAEKKPKEPTVDATIRSVEEVFERFAQRFSRPGLGKADGRFPMYVVFTSRRGLEKKYGQQTATIILRELNRLIDLARKRKGWGALTFLPDDSACMALLGLSPVEIDDPWKLKLALVDLDQALGRKGERIGAVLIVGGEDVIPFHHLPNPTDDSDQEVLSDNPYASRDSNYFVPEWMVGRLPGEASQDSGILLKQIRAIIQYHNNHLRPDSWWRRLVYQINPIIQMKKLLGAKDIKGGRKNLGYTASVWKRSSVAVYRQINDPNTLMISPPMLAGGFRPERVSQAGLAYFNLHGVVDSEHWYGQCDLSEPNQGSDYPVAFSPSDLVRNGKAPQIVFSEACYGAHIFGKKEEQALALKFIGVGSLAFIGSTCVSYGSINTPLIGADLLASLFWKYVKEGRTAGEALMQAKVDMVREMDRRQGYLDGEDQKTLISFVLFGDPLVGSDSIPIRSKSSVRMRDRFNVPVVCDREDEQHVVVGVPSEVLREVKSIVEPYLPGLEDAEVIISREHNACDGKGHQCLSAEFGPKGLRGKDTEGRLLVTISKQVQFAQHLHRHYARVTLNKQGKVVKVALSR